MRRKLKSWEVMRVIFPEVLADYFEIVDVTESDTRIDIFMDEREFMEREDYKKGNQSENLVVNHVTISANHITISANHITISANHITISANHGMISANHGTISANHDMISANHGTISANHDMISGFFYSLNAGLNHELTNHANRFSD